MKGLLSVLFVLGVGSLCAQKVETLEAEYVYHAPENMTLEEAKRVALERAKIEALAKAFGTMVSQTNMTLVGNRNGDGKVDFFSVGGSEVKGEWIETVGVPVYAICYEQEMLVVRVSVRGRAREVLAAKAEVRVRILRNGTEDRCEGEVFYEGDDLYLSFISPVNGYLAVYLSDTDGKVYCLLPYREQTDGIYRVQANRRYLFFHTGEAPVAERGMVDEYMMTCEREIERNIVYVVFSPRAFVKAADGGGEEALPRELEGEEFRRWLARCRKHDTEMQVIEKLVVVKKK